MCNEVDVAYFIVQSQNVSGRTEETYEKPYS
jgi:hypothetical protein